MLYYNINNKIFDIIGKYNELDRLQMSIIEKAITINLKIKNIYNIVNDLVEKLDFGEKNHYIMNIYIKINDWYSGINGIRPIDSYINSYNTSNVSLKFANNNYYKGVKNFTGLCEIKSSNNDIYIGHVENNMNLGLTMSGLGLSMNDKICKSSYSKIPWELLFCNEGYIGEWKHNMKDGFGIYYYLDGTCYAGEWKNNMTCGNGIIFYSSGNIYRTIKKYTKKWYRYDEK